MVVSGGWSMMSHQPVSVNPCKRLGLMLLCCIYCSSLSWFSQRSSEHLKRVQYTQSISVIKLFRVRGYRAVNPQAAWICRVSERVVISRYIFCTACFFFLSFFNRGTPGGAWSKCLLLRNCWKSDIHVCRRTQSMRHSFVHHDARWLVLYNQR